MEVQQAGDWSAYADLFTEEGVYVEHHFGNLRGREAIRSWLVPVMEPCEDWSFPVEWVVIDGKMWSSCG
jgi:hypothetical protein